MIGISYCYIISGRWRRSCRVVECLGIGCISNWWIGWEEDIFLCINISWSSDIRYNSWININGDFVGSGIVIGIGSCYGISSSVVWCNYYVIFV